MALTYSQVGYDPVFITPFRGSVVDVTFDSSYAAGGLALGGSNSGIEDPLLVVGFTPMGGNATSLGYEIAYNTSTNKLQAYKSNAGALNTYSGVDLKGATNPAGTEGNADQVAIPVSGALLYGGNTFTTMAGTATCTTNPDVPRNVMLTVYNSTGGSLNLYQGTTTFTITGTDYLGNAQTETVTLTSTVGNKAIAATKYRYVQGTKAFATVSTVTYDNAADGSLTLYVGVGTRIGLPNGLATGAYTDVKDINITAASVTPGSDATAQGGVDATYNTINTGTSANNWDFTFIYAAAASEVAAGTNLSAVTVRGLLLARI